MISKKGEQDVRKKIETWPKNRTGNPRTYLSRGKRAAEQRNPPTLIIYTHPSHPTNFVMLATKAGYNARCLLFQKHKDPKRRTIFFPNLREQLGCGDQERILLRGSAVSLGGSSQFLDLSVLGLEFLHDGSVELLQLFLICLRLLERRLERFKFSL